MALIEAIQMENCRLCQLKRGVYEINSNRDMNLIGKIYEYTKIQLNDDLMLLLPAMLCLSCKTTIDRFDKYSEQVREVDKALRRILLTVVVEEEPEEEQKQQHKISCFDDGGIQERTKVVNNNKDTSSTALLLLLKCEKCPAVFAPVDGNRFSEHLDSHDTVTLHRPKKSKSLLKCPVCLKCYRNAKNFEAHKLRNHATELICGNCREAFDTVLERDSHLCNVTFNTTTNVSDQQLVLLDERLDKNKSDDTIERIVAVADITTTTTVFAGTIEEQGRLKEHHHHNSQMDRDEDEGEDGVGISNTNICSKQQALSKKKKNEARPFLCVVCGKSFTSKTSLTCHEKIHLPVKGYVCKLCNIGFSVGCNLRAHVKKHHEGVRFCCTQCPKTFVNKCSWLRHEKTHTGIKEFPCNLCTAAFYTVKELSKHQRYHQGLRQYKCDECFKSFFERHHLTVHLRSHTGERPYPCKIPNCGKAFMDSQKLKRHHKARHVHTR